MDNFVLVVMEHASEWPSHVNGGTAGCVALRQEPAESRGELLRRTYKHIRAIERIGGAVELAVLSCDDDPNIDVLEGRVPLARALLATVLRAGEGRLDLVAPSGVSGRTRHSLMALAGTLTEALAGTSASVSARFAEAPAPPASSARLRRRPARTTDYRRSAA